MKPIKFCLYSIVFFESQMIFSFYDINGKVIGQFYMLGPINDKGCRFSSIGILINDDFSDIFRLLDKHGLNCLSKELQNKVNLGLVPYKDSIITNNIFKLEYLYKFYSNDEGYDEIEVTNTSNTLDENIEHIIFLDIYQLNDFMLNNETIFFSNPLEPVGFGLDPFWGVNHKGDYKGFYIQDFILLKDKYKLKV